jgi:hypothetical protein
MLETLKNLVAGMEESEARINLSRNLHTYVTQQGIDLPGQPQPNGGFQVAAKNLCQAIQEISTGLALQAVEENLPPLETDTPAPVETVDGEELTEEGTDVLLDESETASEDNAAAPDPNKWTKVHKANKEAWTRGDRVWVKDPEGKHWFGEIVELSDTEALLQISADGSEVNNALVENFRLRKPA